MSRYDCPFHPTCFYPITCRDAGHCVESNAAGRDEQAPPAQLADMVQHPDYDAARVKAPHVDRGDAVNLARNMIEDGRPTTAKGARMLAEAVLRMDAALSATQRSEILEEAWQAINARIVLGELPGNGWDKTAERNGLVLACNTLIELGAIGRVISSSAREGE